MRDTGMLILATELTCRDVGGYIQCRSHWLTGRYH